MPVHIYILELTIGREDLNPMVLAVRYIHIAVAVSTYIMR
jgi:hypothetical protein